MKAALHSIDAASRGAALLLGRPRPDVLPRHASMRGHIADLDATRGGTTDSQTTGDPALHG